jgi:hypothetical protein
LIFDLPASPAGLPECVKQAGLRFGACNLGFYPCISLFLTKISIKFKYQKQKIQNYVVHLLVRHFEGSMTETRPNVPFGTGGNPLL